jgi:Trypsin-like peptidase domain/NACHT domain
MDKDRVTEVFAQSGQTSSYGSGYFLTDALVLTAGHVVDPVNNGACQVRSLGDSTWRSARVVWRGGSCDAAVLEVTAAAGQPGQAGLVRLGRPAAEWRAPCQSVGFPVAQTQPGSGGRRDTEEIKGEIAPLTRVKNSSLTVHIDGSVPLPDASGRSPWTGMSGAALFCGPLLVAVVTVDPANFGTDRLEAVPVLTMAEEPAFRALLTGQAHTELPLEAAEDITTDWLKARLWRLLSRHAPFGGRDAEIASLNALVAGQKGGYVFVTAPSGYGKTALLAHWLSLVEKRTEDHSFTVYTFMSRLDGLADEDFTLRNLCQQLAFCHGEHGPLPTTASELRSRYIRLLKTSTAGRRLTIILDGLDEASGWAPGPDLFPHDLPAGVNVVFSAREIANRDWLETLELPIGQVTTLPLTTLTRQEVSDLMATISDAIPGWAQGDTTVSAMYAASQGDPFYLRCLVEDLCQGRIGSADELRKQPTGLTAYFDKWWDQVHGSVKEEPVRDLLGYLLVSRGRLTRDELTGISADDKLDGFTFDSALDSPLQRFVVGDAEDGYALSHPRFQAYLSERRIKAPDQKPYRDRLLAWCAHWRINGSRYALVHYVQHLAEAITTAAGTGAEQLAGVVTDSRFHLAYLAMTDDLPGLQRDLELALDRVAELAAAPVPAVVRAAAGLDGFRSTRLRPESVFGLAESGRVDDARRGLGLFEADENWHQVALLVIAWLGAQSAPALASALTSGVATQLVPWPPLPLLLQRVESWLGQSQPPQLKLPYPPYRLPRPPYLEAARQIVNGMGGATDPELHISGLGLLHGQVQIGDEAPVYVAEADSPHLVAFAAAEPDLGGTLLREYIEIHATNPYAEYRHRSLWAILGAVCCHPDAIETRELARLLATAALAPTAVWFREGLHLAVGALRARAGQPGALGRFETRTAEASGAADRLQYVRGQADSWGHHGRRLAALAEAEALVLQRPDKAGALLHQAQSVPFGFAGYQTSSSLTLAEAYRICQPDRPAAALAAVEASRRSAHNIQEPALCAMRTARANAMLERWWLSPIHDLAGVISRFISDPYAGEFAPVHQVGEQYAERAPAERLAIPDAMRQAATLAQIAADVYRLPTATLGRLNPGIGPHDPLPAGTQVSVPERRFAPLMAARLAAEVLADPAIPGKDRSALIRYLVPIAADNPTAMYTILSRLLLAAEPDDPGIAAAALDEIGMLAPSDWLVEPTARTAVEFGPS